MFDVYVVQERWSLHGVRKYGQIKIGVTSDIDSRLKSMQTGNPRDLHCLTMFGPLESKAEAYDLEKKLHTFFKNERLRGEWFMATIGNQAVELSRIWNTYKNFSYSIDMLKKRSRDKRKLVKMSRRIKTREHQRQMAEAAEMKIVMAAKLRQ